MKTRRQLLGFLLAVPALALPVVTVFTEHEQNMLLSYGLFPGDYNSKEAAERAIYFRKKFGPFPKNISAIGG